MVNEVDLSRTDYFSRDHMAFQQSVMDIFYEKFHGGERGIHSDGYDFVKSKDLGRGIIESYVNRVREMWALGLRGDRQVFRPERVYMRIISEGPVYEKTLFIAKGMKERFRLGQKRR